MTQQTSLLTRQVRIAIMCSLITLFFIISPILIMYTAGYRYDTTTHTILETGVISIDIEPRDATAILNNVPIDKQIPIRLTNRAPGKYSLSLLRAGYHSFEQIISVESRQTTYLRDITLFRNALPILEPSPANILLTDTTLYPSAVAAQYIVHSVTDDVHEIGLLTYSLETPEYTTLMRSVADTLIDIAWSPYSDAAVVQMQISEEVHTYLIDTQNSQVSEPVVTVATPLYHWSVVDTDTLYVESDSTFWYARTLSDVVEIAASRIPTPTSLENWYRSTTANTYQIDQTSSTLTFSHPITAIVATRENTILAKQGTALLRFQRQEAQATLVETYEDATLIEQENTLLITTPTSITRVDEVGMTELLLRTSNTMTHVSLLATNRPELVITNSTGIDIFDPRYNMSTTLIQNTTVQSTVVEANQNRIYFFGTVGRQTGVFSLEI